MTQLRQVVPVRPVGWDTIATPQPGLRSYTFSYFRPDKVSSAFQKAVRRALPEEAVQWALEMFWTGGAMRTNIWNRALVCAVEDVGPGDVAALPYVWQLYKQGRDNPLALATAVACLARAPHSRVNDWAVKVIPELATPAVADAVGTLEEMKTRLVAALTAHETGASLYYIKSLFYTTQKLGRKIDRTNNPQILIWVAFREVMGATNPYLRVVEEVGMTDTWRWHKKSRLLHIHLVHLWCNHRMPNAVPPPLALDETWTPVIARLQQHEGLVGIPDYALDKHTAEGKAAGRGIEHFIREGALLVGQPEEWLPLENHYLRLFCQLVGVTSPV